MRIEMKPFVAAVALVTASSFAVPAHAALVNGGFESVSGSPTFLNGMGNHYVGAVGWESTGSNFHTFSPIAGIYDQNYGNVGVVNTGLSLSQSVGTIIQSGGTYTFSGLFGNRNDFAPVNGSVGFFVGTSFSSAAIISELILSAPTVQGTLQSFSFTLASGLVNQFAGQTLGVFIRNSGGQGFSQISIDNLALAETVVTPLPGAVWLFGSVLAAGALRRRMAKKA